MSMKWYSRTLVYPSAVYYAVKHPSLTSILAGLMSCKVLPSPSDGNAEKMYTDNFTRSLDTIFT